MFVTAIFPGLLYLLCRLPLGTSYSISVDTGVSPASKIVYATGETSFGSVEQADKDFNNDGFNDILVCSSNDNAAYVMLGSDSLTSSPETIKFTGTPGSSFAAGCGYAGDVNKDGYADILLGDSKTNGVAYLVLGGPTTASPYSVLDVNARTITYTAESAGTNGLLGNSVAGVGDTNKDGFDDFVLCARGFKAGSVSNAGACYLIYGGNSLQSISMDNLGNGGIKITGVSPSQRFGLNVRAAGDINNDGYADFLASCSGGTYGSSSFLFYGGASLTSGTTLSFSGVSFLGFGSSISAAGDFNGDGIDDVVIASYLSYRTCVVYGSHSLSTSFTLSSLTSSQGVCYFTANGDNGGYSLSGGVDINFDGFDDIIIGAPYASAKSGAAHVIFGSSAPVDSSVFHLGNGGITFNGTTIDEQFGRVVGVAENVTGPNSRALLISSFLLIVPVPSGAPSALYYLHDLFTASSAPSEVPTITPTVTPSVIPSFPPTFVPTMVPTTEPTTFPTVVPSISPTVVPTMVPTSTPSVFETETPTVTPTFSPTRTPSVDPTMTPTQTPSVVLTASPTITPTQTPTLVPSVDPTMGPTTGPTVVPSFRPSAPTYSPSAVPTPVPTGKSKSSVIINAGFTVNSVNGATLTPTSQETIKQSIANVSQATVNNVDLVSLTGTNRRLLLSASSSSVVHRMLATASLFSYKVVAEIHFNLIDFPGLNESYLAGTKSKSLMEAVKTHEFDRIISYYATINNVSQLMGNVTVSDVVVTATVVPIPATSENDDVTLSDGQVAGLAVGITVGAILFSGVVYLSLLKVRSESGQPSDCKVEGVNEGDISVDIVKVYNNFDPAENLGLTNGPSEAKI
jgi:hypothetical protein